MSAFTSVMLDFQYQICIFIHAETLYLDDAVVASANGANCLKFCDCVSPTSIVRPCIRLLPNIIRIIQTLSRYHATKKPAHGWNALKYIAGAIGIILTSITAYYESNNDNN